MSLISEARAEGASQAKACVQTGISARTLQRWSKVHTDQRSEVIKVPHNQLSDAEKAKILSTANSAEFADSAPSQIVPKLADKGVYIASESSFYRVLHEANQLKHRERSKQKSSQNKPKALSATGPNQLYSWDITYLPTSVRGVFYYLYMVMDVYSRKIVGWQIHDCQSSVFSAELMTDICLREQVDKEQVVLHSDNGGPMKGATMLATLQKLGVVPSFSRPSVSNDNPYSESLFRTLKYRPEYPEQRFANLTAARSWVADFVRWYNHEHCHSGIAFVAPHARHSGQSQQILEDRKRVYEQAKARHPERWSGNIRKWEHIETVYLNPEKQEKTQPVETENTSESHLKRAA